MIIRDPPWNSLFDGMVTMQVPTAGNLMHVEEVHDYLRENLFKIFLDFSNQDSFSP